MIVRGNANNANGAVCSAKTESEHTDGLKISARCCLLQDSGQTDLTTGATAITEISQGKIAMEEYGGSPPGQDCPELRGLNAEKAAEACGDQTPVGLQGTFELCPTPTDAVVEKGTGCTINQDWVWTNQACDPAAAAAR